MSNEEWIAAHAKGGQQVKPWARLVPETPDGFYWLRHPSGRIEPVLIRNGYMDNGRSYVAVDFSVGDIREIEPPRDEE